MMPAAADSLADVPDNARLWIIAADRPLTDREQAEIAERLDTFFERWESHGRNVEARSTIEHDRFIVITAFVPGSSVSGCGIDASVRELDEIAQRVGFSRVPALDVLYLDKGEVRNVSRSEFSRLVEQGAVTENTTVFDTSLTSAADWKQGRFESPVSRSWHADVFF